MISLRHIFLAVFLLFITTSMAQKAAERQAAKHYAAHNFVKAAQLWKQAFEKTADEHSRRTIAFNIGMAYQRMNHLDESLQWYAVAIANQDAPTEWLLAQSEVLLKSGKLKDAKASVEKVLETDPYSQEAKQLMTLIAHSEAQPSLQYPVIFSAVKINTSSSDYAASWLNSDLVISSSRPQRQTLQKDGRTSENYSGLFLTIENLYGDFGPALPLPLSNNKNVGVFTWDSQRKTVYYTRCSNRKKRCFIETSHFDNQNFTFSKGKAAAFVNKKYHYGHPFLSEDGNTLFFSAKLPGGYGGNDIYTITILPDGSFGLPVNAGPEVNTAFDEVFPTTLGDSVLIFSSSGHLQGFGGLDMYAANITTNGFENVRVLLPPYNSTADDFSLSLRKGQTKGIFSSNRQTDQKDDLYFFEGWPLRQLVTGKVLDNNSLKGIDSALVVCSSGDETQTTYTNQEGIFQLSLPETLQGIITATHSGYYPEKIRLPQEQSAQENELQILLQPMVYAAEARGRVTERGSGLPMEGEKVSLYGPGGYLATTLTDRNGLYGFDTLQHDRIYTFKVSGAGFFTESRVIRVPALQQNLVLEKSNGYDLDFELTRIKEKEEIILNDIYYDFDKASLREASKTELQKLASMLRETPGVKVQIASHTDERGTSAYNDKLSQERAQAVVDYLIASGIQASRLIAKGFGEQQPIFRNASDEGQHQANRRTTFQVTAYDQQTQNETDELKDRGAQESVNTRLIFRVQVLVSSFKYDPELYFSALRTTIPDLKFYVQPQEQLFRYEAGDRYQLSEAEALRNLIRSAGFADCFIVPYIDGQRVTIQQAREFQP